MLAVGRSLSLLNTTLFILAQLAGAMVGIALVNAVRQYPVLQELLCLVAAKRMLSDYQRWPASIDCTLPINCIHDADKYHDLSEAS